MRLLVQTAKFYAALANSEEREKFNTYFSGNRSFETMPLMQVTLPQARTLSQNAAIWVDFTTVGQLLHCDKNYVYHVLVLRAECLQDIWLKQIDSGWRFDGLSSLSKEEMSNAIPRIRDFLQHTVNEACGEWTPIDWACQENLEKKC